MTENNFDYNKKEPVIENILKTAFYIDEIPNDARIASIRRLAEIIVRKILNENGKVMLGNSKIKKRLKDISSNNSLLMDSLEDIKDLGNQASHTEEDKVMDYEHLQKAQTALYNMYSYLLFAYFKKFRFGSNIEIMGKFSILPPEIRMTVLENLYKESKESVYIIDKLVLSILKTKGKEESISWLEKNKEYLMKIPYMCDDTIPVYLHKFGEEITQNMIDSNISVYEMCSRKIEEVHMQIENSGKRYTTFEDAKSLYIERGFVSGAEEEVLEFNSIMEFLYIGREKEENEKNDVDNDSNYSSFFEIKLDE
ncbi:hypothetical protein [Vagococcus martis]